MSIIKGGCIWKIPRDLSSGAYFTSAPCPHSARTRSEVMTDRLASQPASQPAFHPSIPQLFMDDLLCTGNDLVPAILELTVYLQQKVLSPGN